MSPSTFDGPAPWIAHIYPVHHDHGDGCEAYILDWVSVGLHGLKQRYLEQYPGDPGPVILRVPDYNSPVYEDLTYSIE